MVSAFAAFMYAMTVWYFMSGKTSKAAQKLYGQPKREYINKRTVITAIVGAKLTLLLVYAFTRWPERAIFAVAGAVILLVVSLTLQALWAK